MQRVSIIKKPSKSKWLFLSALGRYVLRVQRLYLTAHIPVSTAALAYYGLFSLLPLFLLLLGMTGFFLKGSPDLYAFVQEEIETIALSLFPMAADVGRQLLDFLTAQALSFTLTSMFFLFWSSSNFFAVLSYSLTLIFGGDPYTFKGRILALLIPFFGGMALIVLALLNLLAGMVLRYLPFSLPTFFGTMISRVLLVGVILFALRILPKEPPQFWPTCLASLGITLSWICLARFLPLLLPKTSYELIYGPFAGFALILFGFYLAMWFLLLGAICLQAALQNEKTAMA